ncbi:MAG: hypothetical protein Q9196_002969 [Gyalolechia fulgens]
MYTVKSRKLNAGTRKVRNESPKVRKDYWQQCISKVHDVSTGPKKPLTRAAALAQLITTAAQYVNIRDAPLPLVNAMQAPRKPASDGEVLKVIMAQIYGDIDNAWLSGMAGLEARLANPTGSAAGKGPLESCLASVVDLEASCVQKVIEYAALWFQDANLEANASSVARRLFSPFQCRILRSKITSFQVKMCRRYAAVATGHGWVMLSILSHSEAFRNACRNLDESSWNKLMQSISHNQLSLELFFKVRGLDWKTPLRQLEQYFSPEALASYLEGQETGKLPDVCFEKPHSYVVPGQDGILHRPNYLGVPQLDIPSTQKGIGVRSLQRIKEGDVLDEYVGEFKYASSVNDATYALELERPLGDRVRTNNPVLIDAQVYGNWTRYINASCEPSLKFMPAIIGNKYRMMVVATRDINVFEELTIGYGDDYWLVLDTRMCECNERRCLYADFKSKEQIRMITGAYADRIDVDDGFC